jgi:hypothetical protein
MKAKDKKAIFICQINGKILKVAKFLSGGRSAREFAGWEVETLLSDRDDKELAEKLSRIFKKLGYSRNPIVISLPRIYATCRQLRVPTQSAQDIEKIIRLRAATYLPYPAEELITAYEVVSLDKEGYSHLNLTIVQNDIISRWVNLFRSFKPAAFSVVLSSYGLSRLYGYLKPEAAAPVILLDIDSHYAELAIIENKKLLFSRCFNLDRLKPDWPNLFIEELNKSRDVYRKEMPEEMPDRVVILGEGRLAEETAEILKKETGLSVETLPYYKPIITGYSADKIPSADYSFAGLAGLGAGDIEESLYLLPEGIKEKARRLAQARQRRGIILLLSAIIALWFLALTGNLDSKSRYLGLLQTELNKIAEQALPLEAMDKRMRLLEGRSTKESLNLAIIPELYKIMPHQIYLTNLACEEETSVTLRGQSPELNSVLVFVSKLEASAVFKGFNIKVKYATKRKTAQGELIDFEITGAKLK